MIATLKTGRAHAARVLAAVAAALFGLLLLGLLVAPEEPAAPTDPTSAGTSPSPADIGFSQDMAVHHAQAIRMADSVRGRVSPEVDAVAAQVFETQVNESGVLKGWLQLWEAPQLPSGPPMLWMKDEMADLDEATGDCPGDDGEAPMPGLASQEEVNRLEDLSGTELEVHFLELMVRHHEGGVVMAQAAAELAEIPVVRSLAEGMALHQQQEITLMLQLLADRTTPPG